MRCKEEQTHPVIMYLTCTYFLTRLHLGLSLHHLLSSALLTSTLFYLVPGLNLPWSLWRDIISILLWQYLPRISFLHLQGVWPDGEGICLELFWWASLQVTWKGAQAIWLAWFWWCMTMVPTLPCISLLIMWHVKRTKTVGYTCISHFLLDL